MKKIESPVFGHAYHVWRRLQHGQESLVRWKNYLSKYPGILRRQTGHDHRVSVSFLMTYYLVKMRKYVVLDELLLNLCIEMHDIPEGITGVDTPANMKKGVDDYHEYSTFKNLFYPLGDDVWPEFQKCYLLQFVTVKNRCMPREAEAVIQRLQRDNMNEAMFFDGLQRLDYLYYAHECYIENHLTIVSVEVFRNQIRALDEIAVSLDGFKEVVWTDDVRKFFSDLETSWEESVRALLSTPKESTLGTTDQQWLK